jgi:type II secretion system protein G
MLRYMVVVLGTLLVLLPLAWMDFRLMKGIPDAGPPQNLSYPVPPMTPPDQTAQPDASELTDVTKRKLDALVLQLDTFHVQWGRYPTQDWGLGELASPPTGNRCRWVSHTEDSFFHWSKQPFTDAWGGRFKYRIPGQFGAYDLWSTGPNRQDEQGQGDDVGNW